MSAILRHTPGEVALEGGLYHLVSHYGEPLGLSVQCARGQRLPFVAVEIEEPVWFVAVEVSINTAQAA